MLLQANPGLRCRNVGQLGFCGRGVFVFGSAFVLCIKVIGSPSAASANPIKHLPASFPSRLQLEKFSAQMHLSHRRSHLCPKRLIALDANCSFGQRRLGSGKTSQSSPELAIMPGRFLLMCVFDICLTSQQIGTLAELSNRQMFTFPANQTRQLYCWHGDRIDRLTRNLTCIFVPIYQLQGNGFPFVL